MRVEIEYRIHGDNIVECERMFELIIDSLRDLVVEVHGPSDSVVCPTYRIQMQPHWKSGVDTEHLHFRFYPGFGRWNQDAGEHVRGLGGVLAENPDVLLTHLENSVEKPILAVEFSSALPAGNQAWQRHGRALSFGAAGIPYLYVSEVGGIELGANREPKSPRWPNPAAPFAYLAYTQRVDSFVLPVMARANVDQARYEWLGEEIFGDDDLAQILRSLFIGSDASASYRSLEAKALSFVAKRAQRLRANSSYSANSWMAAFDVVRNGKSLSTLAISEGHSWKKRVNIATATGSFRTLLEKVAPIAVALAGNDMPFCVIPSFRRGQFREIVQDLYKKIPASFLQWLEGDGHLIIVWVAGFKPRGDDSRPDRGLMPFARMLAGPSDEILTIVYGPARPATWNILTNQPTSLAATNGLWLSLMVCSDAVLVDAATTGGRVLAFTSQHWGEDVIGDSWLQPLNIHPVPTLFKEHDVDTVLHTFFARLAGDDVFEGMCNPPGGDWSGVSLLDHSDDVVIRWVSLPRVTGPNSKRPDHVFQIFAMRGKPVILSVESKDTVGNLEPGIGPRLKKYLRDLFGFRPSVQRSVSGA